MERVKDLRAGLRARSLTANVIQELEHLLTELAVGSEARAAALHVLGLAHAKRRENDASVEALNQALTIYREREDLRGASEVHDTFGQVHASLGRLDLAAVCYAQSLALKQATGDLEGTAITIGNLGRLHLRAGRLTEARECFELDLALSRRLSDVLGIARMHIDLGMAAIDGGEFETAERWLREALVHAVGTAAGQAFFAHKELARLFLERGDTALFESELEAARSALGVGHEPYLDTLLDVLRARGQLERGDVSGLTLLAQCAHDLDEADLPDHEVSARLELAEALSARGKYLAAERQLYRARERARRFGLERLARSVDAAYLALDVVPVADEERDRFDPDPLTRRDAHGYHVVQRLGRGAFGETFKVYDPDAGDLRALKVIQLAHVYDGERRARLVESARQELLAVSGLRHPGIARVFALGSDVRGAQYVVQEWIDGITLHEWIHAPKNRAETVRVARELADVRASLAAIARSLAALHRAGTVHRDLKPANVMLRARDPRAPVLIDFGIASSEALPSEHGVGMGTFGYMAPEQVRGAAAHGSADVYSLGIVAREWLTGEVRKKPSGTLVVVAGVETYGLPSLAASHPDLPRELSAVIDAMTAVDPRARPTAIAAAEVLGFHATATGR